MLRKLCVLLSLFFALARFRFHPRVPPFHISLRLYRKESSRGEKGSHLDSRGPVRRFQEVKSISAQGDLPLKKTTESKYGNQIYYAETSSAQPELHFDVEYDVVRHERVALGQTASRTIVRASLTGKGKATRPSARRAGSRDRAAR